MTQPTLTRVALAAVLFAAIPFASVNAVAKAAAATTSATSAANAAHLANLQSKGGVEIDRRMANLTAAQTNLTASTKLSAADKTALSGQITAELTGLNALKTKLTADTTLAAARVDVASIVSDYRVYVLMLPKTRLVTSTDRFTLVEQQLTDLAAKLQTKIDTAKAAGKNVTAAQTGLTDLKAKTTAATGLTSGVVTGLLAIEPTDYNANHAALATYRATLQTAHDDLLAARADATTVVSALQALK